MAEPKNQLRVTRGFNILLQALVPYVCEVLKHEEGPDWWNTAVLDRLYDEQKQDLPRNGPESKLLASLDIKLTLLLLDLWWNQIFRKRLSPEHRSWAKELAVLRNRSAHLGMDDFSDDDAWRGLDTMARLCDAIDAEKTEQIRGLLREARYGTSEGSMAAQPKAPQPQEMLPTNASGLPSWRDIMLPHPDVAEGRYKNAEFAADLAQVSRGEGALEYRDPVEFFGRTYVTEGMKGLLLEGIHRVCGHGGEPVIQLKTAFGGGKTHSMLALYHLLRGKSPLDKIPAAQAILKEAGVTTLPKTHVAVLVGTALDPSRSKRPPNLSGVTVSTLWGELAMQLAISTGNPKLYDHVREADKKGVSPGSLSLTRLLDEAGSCLVLMDELVAYARKLYGQTSLPAGNFENLLTFIQEITEAARASQSSLVVASIPESNIEIGGEAGQKALSAIEHTFGRMESIWKPVAAHEGFEVVRRRLFLDCASSAGRQMVCKAFSDMYNENPTDFPMQARDPEYLNRLIACYPVHPEVFDRLYEDWATLEHFQRTRGVLRLMAAVIHELWMRNDPSPLIQPGSLPLDAPSVRDELIRRLHDNWNAIVDKEVDGKESVPFLMDKSNTRYGKLQAARRVARAIMLGSAPTVKEQRVRGLESSRIRLGIAQPGDPVALYNDALHNLLNSLAFLYSNQSNDRFWYDTRPTLRKIVEDRASQIPASEVEYELEKRLAKHAKRIPPLMGVHVCPASTLDVPDDPTARMVVLGPAYTHDGHEGSAALKECRNILEHRGNAPRIGKNMLIFLVPEKGIMGGLEEETRRFMAWQSIKKDSEDLNLDAAQNRETDNSLKRSSETVDLRIQEVWCWLFVPTTDRNDLKTLRWETTRLSGTGEEIIPRAMKVILRCDIILEHWSPAPLLMELNDLLWGDKDWLEVKKLWDYLVSYCYLPRLKHYPTLQAAIEAGVRSDQFFGYAEGIDGDRFINLKFNEPAEIKPDGFLVKRAAAIRQKEAERPEGSGSVPLYPDTPPKPTIYRPGPLPPPPKRKRFYMNAELDLTRINRDVGQIMEEVLSHLAEEGRLEIRLDVHAVASDSFSEDTVRNVSENCNALKISSYGFDES